MKHTKKQPAPLVPLWEKLMTITILLAVTAVFVTFFNGSSPLAAGQPMYIEIAPKYVPSLFDTSRVKPRGFQFQYDPKGDYTGKTIKITIIPD